MRRDALPGSREFAEQFVRTLPLVRWAEVGTDVWAPWGTRALVRVRIPAWTWLTFGLLHWLTRRRVIWSARWWLPAYIDLRVEVRT